MSSSTFSPPLWFNEVQLKDQYEWAIGITKHQSKLSSWFMRGTDGGGQMEKADSGGKRVKFILSDQAGGALAFAGGTSGTSLDGIGEVQIRNVEVAYTPFYTFFRSTTDFVEMDSTEKSAEAFFNQALAKIEGAAEKHAWAWNGLLTLTGQAGQLAVVLTGDTVASATVVYNIEVIDVRAIPSGAIVDFFDSAFAAITHGVPGVASGVTSVKNGRGTVAFTFPSYDGTSWVIPTGGQICIAHSYFGSTNRGFINGLQALVNNDTFPRSEGNNIQCSDTQFKAVVKTIAGKISHQKLRALLTDVKISTSMHKLGTDVMTSFGADPRYNSEGYPISQDFVFWMHPLVRDQLEASFWDGKVNFQMVPGFGQGSVYDEGREYVVFQGVPIIEDYSCPQDRVYLLHAAAFAKAFDMFQPLTGRPTGWNPLQKDTGYEYIRCTKGITAVTKRDCLGLLKSSDGFSIGVDSATVYAETG